MNSFENNTPLPTELHPGADRAMDGLLQELANNNIADDEAFLSGLESALDQASGTPKVQPIAGQSAGQRWWRWGLLGSAAACAVGMLVWRESQLKQLAKSKSDHPHEANPSVEPIQNEPLFEVIQNRFATLDEVVASYERISGIQLLRSINLTGNIWMPRAKTASAQLKKEDAVAYYNGAILANGFSLHENSQKFSNLTYDRSVFSSADCSPANVQAAYDARQNSLAMAEAAPSIAEKIVRTGRIEPIQKLETEADQLMTEGNYEAAIDKFQTALFGLPEAPMSAKLRAVLIAKFSNACIRQADKLGKMARLDDAKAMLNRVLVASVDPANVSAKTLLKRLDDPDYYNAAMTEGHYRGMNESTTDFATRRRDHYVAPNLQAPAPSIDKSLPEIPDGAGTTSSYAISGFSMPAAGGIGGSEGGLRGSGRGGAGGGGIGTGYGPGNGTGNGIITRSGTGTLTLSGSTQGGPVRRRMVVPENGLGYVGNNRTTGDYLEANPSDPVSNGEKYSSVMENAFLSPLKAPLSTFSVDVDTASYANLRRMIQSGQNVPPAAVRIEEMVNYFSYAYPQPEGPHPFSVQVESAACPWNEAHRLVKIGLKAKEIAREKRPSANLVFLCDVSGSMNSADKLPLLVQNLTVLTNELNADDSVGIVVYAGSEGVALQPTSGGDKQTILRALTQLSAGGSTNGGAGINRAYQMAQERFIKGGINRVILCTDGDFNVGTTSSVALVNLVEEKAKGGVFLTVCGYGQGNLNDSMMEAITNKGNGVYHYVDSEKEGKKIFKDELFGTLMTVAKDVKLQVEFNPAKVGQYRLVGYDNRMLKKEDFANDKVDAGDIGAGHTVTALYEVIPPGTPAADKPVENLKYQQSQPVVNETPPAVVTNNLPEMLTVKLRYKEPEGTESKLLEVPHTDAGQPFAAASSDFKFASAVAEFGEWIRGKRVAGRSPLQMAEQAESARGNDPHGLRGEFIELVKKAGSQRQ